MTFKRGNMILAVHSNASYLMEPKSRSRAGGQEEDPANGLVHNIAQVIRNVMTLAADTEIGALFVNSRFVIPAWQLLEEMGHPQPPMPIQTDNTTVLGFVTKKATKSHQIHENELLVHARPAGQKTI